MTTLAPAAVVGTDLVFGLVVSLIGGGVNAAMGNLNGTVLMQLLAGGVPGAIFGGLSGRESAFEAIAHGAFGSHGAAGRKLVLRGFF